MVKFGLVHNGKVKVGPRDYIHQPFRNFLRENGIDDSTLPKLKFDNYPIVEKEYKILPVTDTITPNISIYEQLAGPNYIIHENHITEEYYIAPKPLYELKESCKEIIYKIRYKKEQNTIWIGDIAFDVSREVRLIYFQKYNTITEPINFKTKNCWIKLSKQTLKELIELIDKQVQDAFDWEFETVQKINNATTVEEIKNIDLLDIGM